MSDTTTTVEPQDAPETPKPTETVEFWKQKAREQEKRAKDNAAAAQRLAQIEESQKTEAEKTAERVAQAEAEAASVPAKVAAALRDHLIGLHEIDADDAELFLTATEPELLIKQVERLTSRADKQKSTGNIVPREGSNPRPVDDSQREFVRNLFARAQAE